MTIAIGTSTRTRSISRLRLPKFGLALPAMVWWIGFFVVPVVGLPIGFVLGIYLAELQRVGRAQAWPATRHALTAVGLALLIDEC